MQRLNNPSQPSACNKNAENSPDVLDRSRRLASGGMWPMLVVHGSGLPAERTAHC